MRNHSKQPIRRVTAYILCVSVICALCGCAADSFSHGPFAGASSSETSDGWDEATGIVVLENDRIRLEMDTETTHFSVSDRGSGATYDSVAPEDAETTSEEQKNRMMSELSIVYYNSDSAKFVMTSAADSVAKKLHRVYRSGDALRVQYEFGETAVLLAPPVLTVELFENVLCDRDKVDAGVIRRISRYYTLYSSEDAGDEDYEAALEKYPILASRSLYVLSDTVDTLKMMEISDACENAGLTAEMVTEMLSELGISEEEGDDLGFDLTVEYNLTEDGFTAELLTDLIRERSSSYRLQTVYLLEYFACVAAGRDGSFLVPDGSGALIRFNDRSGVYSQPVYGADGAIQAEFKNQLSFDALLPMAAINSDSGTVLETIQSGEETATVNASTVSLTDPVNHAGFSFALRAMDVTDVGIARNIPVYNLYGKHIQYSHPKIRYSFFRAGTGLAELASYARNSFIRDGIIPETAENPESWLLKFSCVMTEPATFLGVPYTKTVTLSECEGITDFISDLDLSNISIRLSGYGDCGVAHGLNDRFSLHRRFGTTAGLKALCNAIEGRVYLDADFTTVYTDRLFDGYSSRRDTAKYINRTIVKSRAYDIVTRQYQSTSYDAYLVSPTLYDGIARGFVSSLKNRELPGNIGISYPGVGSGLTGDYAPARDLDRAMTRSLVTQALKNADDYPLITEKGCLYSLADCGTVCGMPLDSSSFDVESESVPFYPMVLHGSVSYFGTPYNLSVDRGRLLLRSLEYGAGLSWSLITGDEKKLSGTDYETANYSIQAGDNREDIIKLYKDLNEFLQMTVSARITGHEQVGKQTYITDYSNGAAVAVNYGEENVSVRGKEVRAGGYEIWLP